MARVGRRTKVRIDTKDAWGAVRAFEHMIPQLRSYARAMTGNTRLEVQVTAGPTRTDGNTIYITPPLALANKEVHSKRSECGKRSADGKLTCKACNIREVVNFYLYHEVSHILWGTLAMHNEFSLAIWHKMFNSWHHEGCEHYSSILELVDQAGSTMGLAGLLSPFVGMMQNALEDARVNERTFEQRAGLRKIFEINMDRMLIEGSEQLLSGELLHWRDQPLDAQFMVGLYFQASGYHYEGFLHSDAVAMLQNSEIAERVESAKMAEDADAVFALVCEIWLIAQNHGFCVLERCIPEPAIDETPKDLEDGGKDDASEDEGSPSDSDGGSEAGDADTTEEHSSGDAGAGSPGTGGEPAGSSPGTSPGSDGRSTGDELPELDSNDDSSASEGSGDPSGTPAGSDGAGTPDRDGGDLDDDGLAEAGTTGSDGAATAPEDDAAPGTKDSDGGGDPGESGQDIDSPDGLLGESTEPTGAPQSEATGSDDGSPVEDQLSEGSPEVADRDAEGDRDDAGRGHEDGSAEVADGIPGPEESADPLEPAPVAEAAPDEADRDGGGWIDGGESLEESGSDSSDETSDGDATAPRPGDEDGAVDEAATVPKSSGDEVHGDDTAAAGEEGLEGPAGREVTSSPDSDADRPLGDASDAPASGPSGPVGASERPTLGHGTHDDAARALRRVIIHALIEDMAGEDLFTVMGGGEDVGCDCGEHHGIEMDGAMMDALQIAIEQRKYFDTAGFGVAGLNKLAYPCRDVEWKMLSDETIADYMPTSALLSRPTLLARRFFEANAKTKIDSNRKSGRVNTRVLGRRAPIGDPRLFGRKALPKKTSYAVTIVVDCSGSMGTYNMERIKKYSMAMAEILHRLGIPFSMFGHSAAAHDLDGGAGKRRSFGSYDDRYWVYIMPVKQMHEPWNDKGRERLVGLSSVSANLDGHALEYARKEVMTADATDKIIFYFSDGGMPAENRAEEKEILEREIPLCRKLGITLLGGGIDSDATAKVGMDTVMLRREEDITKLIEFLQKNLTRSE